MLAQNEDYRYYQDQRQIFFASHKGEFVLIKGKANHGFFKTSEEALVAGLKKFGDEDFLIQEVTDEIRTTLFLSEA